MNFFFDNCLSPRLAEALAILEPRYQIVHLTRKFHSSTQDITWINSLSDEGGWVILSGDTRITRNPNERRAWHESGLTAFFFGDKFSALKHWQQVETVVRWWPAIAQEAREYRQGKQGDGYIIPRKGKEFKVLTRP